MCLKRFSAALAALVMSAGMAAYFPVDTLPAVSADEADYYYHYDMENGVSGFTGRGAASVSSSSDAFKGNGALVMGVSQFLFIPIPLAWLSVCSITFSLCISNLTFPPLAT